MERERRGAGAAVVTGDQHVVGVGLGHARRDRAHPDLGHQLHADPGARIDRLEVVDELRQVLDRVDVVVRRRRDELDARHRVAEPRDQLGDLVRRELAAFARLGALDDLDLQLFRPHQVLGGDAEARRGDLLDPVVGPVAVVQPAGSCAGPRRPRPSWSGRPSGSSRWRAWRAPPARARRATSPRRRSAGGSPRPARPRRAARRRPARTASEVARARRPARGRSSPGSRRRPRAASRLHRLLQRHDDRRRPAVVLALLAEADPPMVGQRDGLLRRRVRGAVPRQHVLGDLLESDPADGRRGAGEAGGRSPRGPGPRISKIWPPQYEESVEMPIFDRILSSPFSAAERNRRAASRGVGRGSAGSFRRPALLCRTHRGPLASASHGCTASAP